MTIKFAFFILLFIGINSANGRVIKFHLIENNWSENRDSVIKVRIAQEIQKAKCHLNMAVGYFYGVVPFANDTTRPSSYYKSEGVFSATIFKIPLQAVFSFSDINSNFGLNNYFRITFDYNKYINDSKLKYAEKTSLYSASSYVSELTNKETREAIKLQSIKFSPSFINKISAEKDSLMLLKSVWNDDIAIDSLNLLSLKNKIISLENINSRCVAIQNT